MKELSTEEKAKRYDLAIEAARCIYNNMKDGGDFGGMEDLEVIFPELKESEDEKIRKWLIEMVEEVRKANPTNAEHNGRCSKAIAWLEKQGEQKPAWSEEDETTRNALINLVEMYYGSCIDKSEKNRLLDWLKSLRPQNTWKPSEEQIAVLNEVINYAANSELQHWSSFIYTLLKSLREQLKKLSEE